MIDFTGVGRPVYDLFLQAGLSPVGVLITGGHAETQEGQIYSVPKIVLISRLQALLHTGQLKIHKDLPEAPVLVRELQDFRIDFTSTGSMTFSARSGKHDDALLALALAVWRTHRPMLAGWAAYELARRMANGTEAPRCALGVDLGQSKDYTALCAVRRLPAAEFVAEVETETKKALAQLGSLEWLRQHGAGA